MTRLSTRRKMLLALLGGAVAGLGQAPFSLTWLALAGLLAGFLLFNASQTTRQAAWIGWAFGVGYFALVLSWIVEPFLVDIARHGWMAPFALIGLSGGLALFWGLAFGLARWQGSSLALVVFWAGAEVLRSIILTGFPWGLLGYIWLDTGLAQLAATIGPHGLTLITLAGVWALLTALRHRWRLVLVPLVVMAFAYLIIIGDIAAGLSGLGTTKDRPMVRLVQPNAPQHQKWKREFAQGFFERSLGFTLSPTSGRVPDVVIWPETSVPYLLNRSGSALAQISAVAGGVPVVIGIQRLEGETAHNSLVVLDADGEVSEIYDKSHLVPFGEYIPGGKLAAAIGLNGLAAQGGFGFGAGPGLRLIDVPGLGRALPLICYEAIFPEEVGGINERPDLLLQITNDAWFGDLTGPYQHLAQARFRAIEQGLPMVRAANTGVSAVIDARGNIRASLPMGKAGFLDAPLPHALPPTIYARNGDWPVWLLLLTASLMLWLKRRVLND